ncbi:MAG TPA: capsule assembly Wzi family protein [Candidatus Saccharimonadales bacterium]|jgi:hypothetical protein|nr:capsule assembly Wzi family protein [Candidatus Saccharimonadales bacterium]
MVEVEDRQRPSTYSNWIKISIVTLCLGAKLWSQTDGSTAPASAPPTPPPAGSRSDSDAASLSPKRLLRNVAIDQKDIWTSPFRARVRDLNWLAPAIGLSAGLINADAELSSRLSTTSTTFRHAGTVSNGGVAALVAGGGGLFLLGRMQGDDQKQEAGILAGEAAVNAFVVDEVFKVVSRRERPMDGTGQGRFGQGASLNSSFPSNHAMVAWSIASVLAHEYPGILTKVLAYGTATAVSVTRVTGKNHFPSDVVAGSTMGWLIGRQIYARRHDAEPSAFEYGTFSKDRSPEERASSDSIASPYVPIDSWVYPAFERLSGLGVIPSGFLGLRPWTRQECARLLAEADEYKDHSSSDEASRLYAALALEFKAELGGDQKSYLALDSIYARATSISGPPLTDGYHFNKTIPYDYGRPYQRGLNYVGGITSSASAGALGFYVRAEYQHAPGAAGISQTAQDAIQIADEKNTLGAALGPSIFQPVTALSSVNRPRIIEAYLSLNVKGWQMSFGKQGLWTGPTRDAFAFSNNAEPLYMFRVDQTSPRKLPGFLGRLGPYRAQFFFGELTGHHYVNEGNSQPVDVSLGRSLRKQPMLHAEMISFKPTPNFEFGVTVTTEWGGPGVPINLGEVRRTLLTFTNPTGAAAVAGLDPGDRNSYFNWSYRVPGLRKWLTVYEDSFSEDEISPIGYPRRSAHDAGLYVPRLPKLHQLDFRFEGGYTDLPGLIQPTGGGFYYWNIGYLDGYTNNGNIIGSTLGRRGVGFRAATTYWLAADKTIQLSYRNMETNKQFLQGGNLRDIELRSEWSLNPRLSLTSMLQYEWWNYPLLSLGNRQTNFTASFQLTYWPHWKFSGEKR